MKPFKSFLAPELEEFLSWRKNMGLKTRNSRMYLRYFDRYILQTRAGWSDFTPEFFLQLQSSIVGGNRSINLHISAVHGVFKYLVRKELMAENPLQDIPSRPENRFIPFIFAPQEVDRLLFMAEQRIRKQDNKKYFFRDYTVAMAFTLLARCGLRISEPLSLALDAFRPDDGTIYIRKTKFYKDRLLPVPSAVAVELQNYLTVRSRFMQEENPYLFPGILPGRGITPKYIYPLFYQVVKDIGISREKRIIGTTTFGAPTVHSLRHSFAVNTLKRTHNPQNALPVLSAYMGHRKYVYTALYLKMLDADQRNNLVDFSHPNGDEL
jgi:site-specific recombinase XerD